MLEKVNLDYVHKSEIFEREAQKQVFTIYTYRCVDILGDRSSYKRRVRWP